MTDKKLCSVCGKVVGPWHKTGIHPKCGPKADEVQKRGPLPVRLRDAPVFKNAEGINLFDPRAQSRRDAILRGINGAPRQRG